jgi:murein DD-endopeptidase MepM/ murein hydrolase activator NlpD
MGKAVVPDLPYVRKDVPDGSEAPETGGRFARWMKSASLHITPASKGTTSTDARPHPGASGRRRIRYATATLCVALASALSVTLLAPGARAEGLNSQRTALKQQMAKTRGDLNESSEALTAAGIAVDRAQSSLDVARAQLARTERELRTAKAKDAAAAARLTRARADLRAAKAAVKAGQARLDAQKAMMGQVVREQYQQQTNLIPIAVLVDSDSTEDLQTRIQWSTTMFDTTQAQFDRLTVVQGQLDAAKARQAQLEAQVADDRQAAAATLEAKRVLEAKAASDTARVAQLLRARRAAQASAAADVAQDKRRYAKLTRERATVEHRIAVRIAQAKAAAARQRAAQRRAAAAARRAGKASKASRRPVRSSRPSHSNIPHRSSGSAHHGFIYPVSAPITSPYGMRFHPVLHYWKLHDGTDFGAGCGTAIHATYSGRVAERYYNSGYGNRLMIDHGNVDGRYVTTGYNHAIRYVVSVGQHVRQGQVIGYVGTTGFSTGCHLHLMVWLNGRVVNPMIWY